MEKFLNLPIEKQKIISDAALLSFALNGYKKTSVSDIAQEAGISKAMVFHYFGTKRTLYLYLVELCGQIIMDEMDENFDYSVTDFFDRITQSMLIKLAVIKRHPAIPSFINSAYFEDDREIKVDICNLLLSGKKSEALMSKIAFEGIDAFKFKNGIDPELVFKMLTWMTYGCMNRFSGSAKLDYDALCREFEECLKIMKNNFYKQEYL